MTNLVTVDVKYLPTVGPVKAALLKEYMGISNVRDLLFYFPFRHVDRSRFYAINEFNSDMPEVQVRGRFVQLLEEGEGRKRRLRGLFTDGRATMEVLWFNRPEYFRKQIKLGTEYVVFGKPSLYYGVFSMSHPEIEIYRPDAPMKGFEGVYSIPEAARNKGISNSFLKKLMGIAMQHKAFAEAHETLPEKIVAERKFMPVKEAIRNMHFPVNANTLQKARERLKFEELFYLEMHILRYARLRKGEAQGYYFPRIGEYFNRYYSECLPFELTGAQKRVLKEIRADMATGRQMNRLLQGDVGCGKTMVAFMTMLMAVDNGFQAAMMAPTEILASQHYDNLREWCENIGLQCRLLTGSTKAKARKEIAQGLADGAVNILVGTHALIEDTVQFSRLGLAVIDEQHRFGVAQRAKLWKKGTIAPHVLVMTATPIPRTLAMTVYGDLDVSVIDELPPGRKPVTTLLRSVEGHGEVDRLVYNELMKGHQAYFVYPLIRENEKLELKSLEEGFEQVSETFNEFRVCMVHGQMKPDEKDHQMELFVSGKANIMVATTVIEVGVNVPNASVMVIENAERFGLSQLHQLRGRVGRGADQSYCILTAPFKISGDTRKRLDIMTETTDGFIVAEADLKLRGPGDMEGTQQSGLPLQLRVASLVSDGQILTIAREAAAGVLERPDEIGNYGMAIITSEMNYRFPAARDWSRIS